jgi:hypothetical protein
MCESIKSAVEDLKLKQQVRDVEREEHEKKRRHLLATVEKEVSVHQFR